MVLSAFVVYGFVLMHSVNLKGDTLLYVGNKERYVFILGERAGRVTSESEHQKGRAIPI